MHASFVHKYHLALTEIDRNFYIVYFGKPCNGWTKYDQRVRQKTPVG